MIGTIELGAAVALLAIGFLATFTARNALKTVVGVEIMSKSVLIPFLASGHPPAQGIVVLLILVDAVVVAVLMAMVVAVYRHEGSLDVQNLRRLAW